MVSVPLFVTFSAAGSYTWTAPPGVTAVTVACTGAGGGAGAAAAATGSNGGGGGGGECAIESSVAVTPGSIYQLQVGTGGPGGTTGGSGAAGTDSFFTGDALTVYAHGGQGGTAAAGGAGQRGSGGSGSVNAVSAIGGAGDDGTVSANGGGGGGAAGAAPGAASYGALAGAFLDPVAMGTGTFGASVTAWQTWTGTILTTIRDYRPLSNFTQTSNMTYCITNGIKMCLTLRPAYNPTSSADLAALDTLLSSLKSQGLQADVALWHEPFTNGLTQAQYAAMIAYYGPTVRTYYPLVFCVSSDELANHGVAAWYPGDTATDKVAIDYYCNAYQTGQTLDAIAAIGDPGGKPVGVWEFNANTSTYTQPQVTAFFRYVQSFFTSRAQAGKPNANILLFNSTGTNVTCITAGTDYRIALYDTIAAGGGSAGLGFPGNNGNGAAPGGASGGTFPGGAGGAGSTSGAGPGSNGAGPGGGGGGALSTGTARAGGNGADGQVIITWVATDPITLPNATPGGLVQMQAPLGISAVKAECWGGGAGGFNSRGSGTALAGSTTFSPGYGGGTTTQAATTFDGYVNRPLAITAQVRYWHEGDQYPSNRQNLPELAGLGAKVYACLKPKRIAVANGGAQLTAEKSALSTTCTNINAVSGLTWVAVLWQEPTLNGRTGQFGDGTSGPHGTTLTVSTPAVPASNATVTNSQGNDVFVNLTGGTVTAVVVSGTDVTLSGGTGIYSVPSGQTIKITYTGSPAWAWWLTPWGAPGTITELQAAANYISYHQAFAPTVRSAAAGIQIAYKPAVSSIAPTIDFFPGTGNKGCDLVVVDFYCLDFTKKTNATNIFGAGSIEAVADANGLPFGLGEWGLTDGIAIPSQSDWNSFITNLVTGFTNRINAGKPISDCIFYTGQTAGGPNNVTGPSDFKVPGIRQVSDVFTSASAGPVGGAGGGGGEYAAEASLAISSPAGVSLYTLNVGAGGAGRTSGGSSSLAGDSVTVTGHGGTVATTQSAGGPGGTGSANTTHHDGGAGGAGGASNSGGGGGGGSGGTSAAGNAGGVPVLLGAVQLGGAGGAAVTGGGPGGAGGGGNADGSPPPSGPGGGGGARGATGQNNGAGADGQITLSNFVTHPACTGNFGLAGLGFSGGSITPGGNYGLAGLGFTTSGTVGGFALAQNGSVVVVASGNITFTLPAGSTAGTLLVVQFVVNSLTAATGPGAPWVRIGTQAVGNSGAAHAETWMYNPSGDGITGGNPGGISSAVFNAGTSGVRGHMLEFRTLAPNTVAQLALAVATNSGGPGVTSFQTSCGLGPRSGDLGLYLVDNLFSAAVSVTWNAPTPAGWVLAQSQGTGIANTWQSNYNPGLNLGAQSVTASDSSSTNETGWAGIFAVFTPVVIVSATGGFALAPLALAASGSAVVPPNTVLANGGFGLAGLGFQSPSLATTFPAKPLPIKAEILINGTWTDISNYLYQRAGISIANRGRPDEASVAQPTQVTLTLNNRDGTFSPQNTSSQFFPFLVRNTQIRISVNNAVTPQGAWYSGYRFWGEVPAWPPLWDPSGADVYVAVTAAGVLQRMRQSKFSASPITRYYSTLIGAAVASGQGAAVGSTGGLAPAGYWPCEDGNTASSFFSGIPGGSPMTYTGTPGLSSDSSVKGSAPFAQLNGSIWTGTPGAFSSGGITFATPGTYQWACPGGVTSIKAECWGGGGGGTDGQKGCGGGGGEYAAEPAIAVTPGKFYTVIVGAGGSGGAGTFSLSGNPGAGGSRSVFSGDTATVTAHGGKGGSGSSGGNGGTGSQNTTHHPGGSGGDSSTGRGGSGGGGSGGSVATGNNGSRASSDTGASGGSAVTGGGPGGKGGQGSSGNQATAGNTPSPGPGGGGGGGGENHYNSFGLRGGNGYAGQVTLTFGTSTIPAANVVRAIIDAPQGGGTDQANMLSFTTTGSVANAQLSYHTGGSLQFAGHDANNNTLFDSGIQSFGANGQPMLVSCELTMTGGVLLGGVLVGGTIHWKLTAITPGAAAVVATFKGSFTGLLGAVTQVNVNNTVGHTDTTATGVGHISVQYAVDPVLNLSQALSGYNGELAATRFARLCSEQRMPVAITGNATDTPQMGPQPAGLLVDLLQDCENADLGQMFERRDAFGLGYRTRVSLQNQPASVVLDYSLAHLATPIAPTNDDQLTRNLIVATRAGGGTSYQAVLSTGPMSVQDPPNGVGLYTYSVTTNLFADVQLAGFAAWLLILGTLDEYRFPVITVDMARSEVSDGTFGAMASLDIGGYLQIVNPPSWLPPIPINQLAFGFAETLNALEWTIAVSAVPEDPYSTGSSGTSLPLPTW